MQSANERKATRSAAVSGGRRVTTWRPRLAAGLVSRGVGTGVAVSAGAGLLVWLTRAPFRAERLSGWDPVNFALALDRWDLAVHQPHPPGYLGYVVLGRLARLVTGDANGALILVGAAATAAAGVVLWRLAAVVGVPSAARCAGTVAFLLSPLVWFYSSVAEVYALEMLCALLVAAACLRVRCGESPLWPPALAFAVCAFVKPPTAILLLPLATVAPAGRRLASLGAAAGAVAAVLVARSLDDPAMPSLTLAQFLGATAATQLAGAAEGPVVPTMEGLNRHVRDVLQGVLMIGGGAAVALPVAAWRALRPRVTGAPALDPVWVAAWAAPMLAVFLLLHFPKPGYLLPLVPLAFLALMAGLAPMGRRGTIALAGIAVAGGVQFLALGPLPASVTGDGLRYADKTLLQRLATDLEPVTFASARTVAGVDSRIDLVRSAVDERCDADGVIVVSDGGAIDWRQSMYYLPAHRVVRAALPDEPLMVAYGREVAVHPSLERLQSACPAIWIGDEPAAAALPDFPAPIVESVSAGLWSVGGRFAADVGGEHGQRRLLVEPARAAP